MENGGALMLLSSVLTIGVLLERLPSKSAWSESQL